MLDAVDRPALAAALKTYRARLSPADLGLPAGTRRRVAGLRREEVALLVRQHRGRDGPLRVAPE